MRPISESRVRASGCQHYHNSNKSCRRSVCGRRGHFGWRGFDREAASNPPIWRLSMAACCAIWGERDTAVLVVNRIGGRPILLLRHAESDFLLSCATLMSRRGGSPSGQRVCKCMSLRFRKTDSALAISSCCRCYICFTGCHPLWRQG